MKKWIFIMTFLFVACKTLRNVDDKSARSNSANTILYHPLRSDSDLNILIKEIGDAKIVLLGESTHGTHEFYEWRAAITKKLIEEKGFNFIAIEGDWSDSYKVDQYIRGPQKDSIAAVQLLKQYDRWPRSMWGNYE